MQENSFDQPYPPEKQGMGCLPKVLIGLAVGGAVCLALCCGLGWYFTSQAMKTTEEPAEIEEIRRGIVNIDLPEDMPPSFGGEFNFGMFQMEMAGYGEQQGKFLMLMQMQVAGLSEEEMKQQFRQQAAQQQNESVRITNSETRTLTIDGQPEEFVFAEGMMQTDEGETPIRQVTGTFPSREGHGFLMLIVPEEEWNEDEVVEMIESIRK